MRVDLTHPLGRQTFELSPTTIEDPIVIGRSSQADIQVPSIQVSLQHAVLFVHQDHWVVQDSGSGTFVNGQRINEPVILKTGDVITFETGSQAARLSIVSVDSCAIPAKPPIAAEPDIVSWQTSSPVTPLPARLRKRNRSSPTLWFSIFGFLLIAVSCVAVIIAYLHTRKTSVQSNPTPPQQNLSGVSVVKNSESTRQTIFMYGGELAKSPSDPKNGSPVQPASVDRSPSNQPGPTQNPPADPETDRPDSSVRETDIEQTITSAEPDDLQWQKLLEARDTLPPSQALYQYLQYRKLHAPDDIKRQKLDDFQNEAIDLLWWQRINDLVHQQNQIQTQIEELKQDKSKLPRDATPERRQQFDKQIRHLESLYNSNLLILRNEMKFEGNQPFDWSDESHMRELRNRRDVDAYQRWTQRVLSRVQSTRGASAW